MKKDYALKKLRELKNENKGKYFRKQDEILSETYITEKKHSFNNEYLIEVSTNHNSSNRKVLKIWKLSMLMKHGGIQRGMKHGLFAKKLYDK